MVLSESDGSSLDADLTTETARNQIGPADVRHRMPIRPSGRQHVQVIFLSAIYSQMLNEVHSGNLPRRDQRGIPLVS